MQDGAARRTRAGGDAEPGLRHVAAAVLVAAVGGALIGFGFGRVMDRGATAPVGVAAGPVAGETPVPAAAGAADRPGAEKAAGGRSPNPAPAAGSVPRDSRVEASPRPEAPAWQRFAAAGPEPDGRPMIAIVIDDVGHNPETALAMAQWPAPVTFAMLPYGRDLPALAAAFRRAGHELLVHLPMEPTDPATDPGPNALTIGLDEVELRRRLAWNLDQFTGYVGVNNHMGSRFTSDAGGMAIVLAELNRRGLIFLDSRTAPETMGPSLARWLGVPQAERDIFLDNDLRADNVREWLRETERTARRQGHAIAIGHPHKVTIETVGAWLREVGDRGFALVPVSRIVRARLAS